MARARKPAENMPCPNTLGRPAAWAFTSSWCIGLKSPDAPAYMTRSVRVSSWVTTGASSPSGARAAGVRIVGKTNLHELAFGTSGINPWFGTPTNPLDPGLVPGGSSSGSAVAVATDEADVALGSDTGGSVRIPSACCGTAGLKTTWGRVSLEGVWPLSLSLDTIGPMARDVRGVITGMTLLEPGFQPA